ncbi:MAG TPA: hypothetical protein VM686_27055 [Polyangiaceae bacterium]|nr:hypothetical protein [Polyangiaceae bacterium]
MIEFSVPAVAQEARNPAVAEALFEEAQQLVKAGDYEKACPKFKQSYEADPAGGTLLNLADCYEREGKTALAWSSFREARVVAQREGRNDRVAFADERLKALEQRLSRLTIVVISDRAPGQTVTLDGVTLGETAWGVALPVDPGRHELRSEAPGRQPFVIAFDVAGPGDKHEVEVPPLASTPAERTDSAPVAEKAGGSSSNTLGWVFLGGGVVAVGAGSYFGLQAISRWDERNDLCAGGCTEDAKEAGDDAQTSATISTVGFGVGLAAIAVGSYLLLTSGKEAAPPASARARRFDLFPALGKDAAGLSLRGDW